MQFGDVLSQTKERPRQDLMGKCTAGSHAWGNSNRRVGFGFGSVKLAWWAGSCLNLHGEICWTNSCRHHLCIMAKDKERSVNPAQQQHKLEKAKALKKGKADVQARRNEKLARRNPERLQRQVDDLKALEESGQIKPREKQLLEQLQKDVNAIRKARGILGDKAPQFSHGRTASTRTPTPQGPHGARDDGILGKRRRDGERKHSWHGNGYQSSGSETDESIRRIPMPKDTPPPIPPQARRNRERHATSANAEPLGGERLQHGLPEKPTFLPQAKTTYESAPQVRDLRKEAVARFVPSVVRKKQDIVIGSGGLVEPEELDRLEREGYVHGVPAATQDEARAGVDPKTTSSTSAINAAAEAKRLAEEEERFQRELRQVQIEEVSDEDL